MSNRQERRRRHETHLFIDEHGARLITSTGHKVEVAGKRLDDVVAGAALDDVKPGQHLWITIASFRVVNPEKWTTEQQIMDTENLVNVTPPGCYVCEQPYTPAVAARRCPGEPS